MDFIMQVTVLSLDSNSAQVRIDSDQKDFKGLWMVQNIAPHHEEFKSIISNFKNSQNPSEIFSEIQKKFRLRRVGV